MNKIQFSSDKHNNDVLVGIFMQLFYPLANVFKRLLIRYIVNDQGSAGSPEMPVSLGLFEFLRIDNCLILFLAGSIPDLSFHSPSFQKLHSFRCKFDPDRILDMLGNFALDIPSS